MLRVSRVTHFVGGRHVRLWVPITSGSEINKLLMVKWSWLMFEDTDCDWWCWYGTLEVWWAGGGQAQSSRRQVDWSWPVEKTRFWEEPLFGFFPKFKRALLLRPTYPSGKSLLCVAVSCDGDGYLHLKVQICRGDKGTEPVTFTIRKGRMFQHSPLGALFMSRLVYTGRE